jgi:hypothetical protein
MSDIPAAFQTFFERIELDAFAEDRIASAWERLRPYLAAAYGIPASAVFVQGSTANGTAIRPEDEDDEIDLDIIVNGVGAHTAAAQAIRDMRQVLSRDGDLKQRLEDDAPGRPCVRLRYAPDRAGKGFHIDITPARTGQSDGPLDVPMRGREDWKATAPAEYTQWCYDQGEPFRRTVRMLKRWRDHNDAEIKSIVLQVLIARHMPQAGGDAERLTGALEGIRDFLATSPDTAPVIENPVLPSENLAGRWDDDDYRRFRITVGEAARQARTALASGDQATSHTLWKALLGDDFPGAGRGPGRVPPVAPPPVSRPNPDRGRQYG